MDDPMLNMSRRRPGPRRVRRLTLHRMTSRMTTILVLATRPVKSLKHRRPMTLLRILIDKRHVEYRQTPVETRGDRLAVSAQVNQCVAGENDFKEHYLLANWTCPISARAAARMRRNGCRCGRLSKGSWSLAGVSNDIINSRISEKPDRIRILVNGWRICRRETTKQHEP